MNLISRESIISKKSKYLNMKKKTMPNIEKSQCALADLTACFECILDLKYLPKNRPNSSETYIGDTQEIFPYPLKKQSINTSRLPNLFPCPRCAVELAAIGNG